MTRWSGHYGEVASYIGDSRMTWNNGLSAGGDHFAAPIASHFWPSGIVDGSGNMRIGWATIEANNTGYKVRLSKKENTTR